jgi:4-alpha-glucanotransferase
MMTDALALLAQRAGVVPSYTDQTKRRRRTGRDTMRALLAAMGLPAETQAEARDTLAAVQAEAADRSLPPWAVVETGCAPSGLVPGGAHWTLRLEDGSELDGAGDTVPPLPLGLHVLKVGMSGSTLICAPARLPLPPLAWGVMLPLHALRPPETGGLADYTDLATAAEGFAGLGAAFVGLNPIHAGFWGDAGGFSPYTPSHRRRLSAFHLADGGIPRAGGPLIDYGREIGARREALDRAFQAFTAGGPDPAFAAFRAAQGRALEVFCLHQALSDRFGPFWRDWPAPLRHPDTPEIAALKPELSEAIAFHAWLQWRAARELSEANARAKGAGMGIGLYLDLAVGTHPHGAETWEDRDSFAHGASLGAPPDAFSADGQSWGLAPFNPRALVAKGFGPLAETLRCQMALSGAIRIDHILGFDRAFWVPEGGAPGAYVRMPRDAMLAVVRMEAARAGAVVVGEDLGNVPRGLRRELESSGILGCRVMLFERGRGETPVFRDPARYPARSIASFSTHDLPTWAGWRKGREIDARLATGDIAVPFAEAEHARRRTERAAFDAMTATAGDGDPASADAMHRALAQSRSRLAMVQVENVLGIEAQPNLPGTTSQYPNWRQRLPLGPEALADDPGMVRTAAIMNAARGPTPRGRR